MVLALRAFDLEMKCNGPSLNLKFSINNFKFF